MNRKCIAQKNKVGLGRLSGMNLIESKNKDTYCLGEECNIDLGSRSCSSKNILFQLCSFRYSIFV